MTSGNGLTAVHQSTESLPLSTEAEWCGKTLGNSTENHLHHTVQTPWNFTGIMNMTKNLFSVELPNYMSLL